MVSVGTGFFAISHRGPDDDGWLHTVEVVVTGSDIRTPVNDITFAKLALGQTEDKTTTIYNDGENTLTVSDISATSGDTDNFSLVSPSVPFTIAAGGSQEVTIRYSP